MNNDFWNYSVSCEYASKMQNGKNKRQKNKNAEYLAREWVREVIAGVIVLVCLIAFGN